MEKGSQAQGATQNKYDRQIRMWGAHGQATLAQSRICLLTAGATGVEVMKNLVLPCMGERAAGGYITVVDDAKASARDLGNNFFVTVEDLHAGQDGGPLYRCEATVKNLCEMNAEVDGRSHVASPLTIAETDPTFFEAFTCVVASDMPESAVVKVAALCAALSTPLFIVRSYGLVGYCRLQAAEHAVVEGKPHALVPDLRLRNAWPELLALGEEYPLGTLAADGKSVADIGPLSHVNHQQIPAPLLAAVMAKRFDWSAHKGLAGKKAFRKHLLMFSSKWQRAYKEAHPELHAEANPGEGKRWPASLDGEPNFSEAAIFAFSVLGEYADGNACFDDCEEFDAMLERSAERVASLKQRYAAGGASAATGSAGAAAPPSPPSTTTATARMTLFTQKFWVLAEALRRFYAAEGEGTLLPLAGDIPDYAGSTTIYLALEACYQAKAEADCATVAAYAAAIVADCGMVRYVLVCAGAARRFDLLRCVRPARSPLRAPVPHQHCPPLPPARNNLYRCHHSPRTSSRTQRSGASANRRATRACSREAA